MFLLSTSKALLLRVNKENNYSKTCRFSIREMYLALNFCFRLFSVSYLSKSFFFCNIFSVSFCIPFKTKVLSLAKKELSRNSTQELQLGEQNMWKYFLFLFSAKPCCRPEAVSYDKQTRQERQAPNNSSQKELDPSNGSKPPD